MNLERMDLAPKSTTVRMEPQLRAKVDDLARERRMSVSRFLEWVIQQVLDLDFLSKENREFVRGLRLSLGPPWSDLNVIECLISSIRKEIRAGRIVPSFWLGIEPKPAETRPRTISPESRQAPSQKKSTGD